MCEERFEAHSAAGGPCVFRRWLHLRRRARANGGRRSPGRPGADTERRSGWRRRSAHSNATPAADAVADGGPASHFDGGSGSDAPPRADRNAFADGDASAPHRNAGAGRNRDRDAGSDAGRTYSDPCGSPYGRPQPASRNAHPSGLADAYGDAFADSHACAVHARADTAAGTPGQPAPGRF